MKNRFALPVRDHVDKEDEWPIGVVIWHQCQLVSLQKSLHLTHTCLSILHAAMNLPDLPLQCECFLCVPTLLVMCNCACCLCRTLFSVVATVSDGRVVGMCGGTGGFRGQLAGAKSLSAEEMRGG